MKRIMVRLDDDLYTRIFETAHDRRQSMNQFMVECARYGLALRVVISAGTVEIEE